MTAWKPPFITPPPAAVHNPTCWQHVLMEMSNHVAQHITPIAEMDSPEAGHAWGTGTYLRLQNKVYIVTNEHVARKMASRSLAHLPDPDARYVRINNPFQAIAFPEDVALARLNDDLAAVATQLPVEPSQIDRRFQPVEWEFLFVNGFPSYSSPKFVPEPNRRTTLFGTLNTPSQPYMSQLCRLPEGYNPEIHFALVYPSEGAQTIKGGTSDTPDPRGMSGSLIWDTYYIATDGKNWTPHQSRVCGIVHRWDPDTQCLIGTTIESAERAIIHCLRREAAYFRWLDDPTRDALENWLWAERSIVSIHDA